MVKTEALNKYGGQEFNQPWLLNVRWSDLLYVFIGGFMSDWIIIFSLLACLIGGYCIGALWYLKKVSMWRIRWIELEYKSAQAEGRHPRNIDDVFSV